MTGPIRLSTAIRTHLHLFLTDRPPSVRNGGNAEVEGLVMRITRTLTRFVPEVGRNRLSYLAFSVHNGLMIIVSVNRPGS